MQPRAQVEYADQYPANDSIQRSGLDKFKSRLELRAHDDGRAPRPSRRIDGTHRPVGSRKGAHAVKRKFHADPFHGRASENDEGHLQNLVTTDGFDQVQAYYAFSSLMTYMGTLGYDMAKIANVFPILINVNAVDDVNAWYNPSAVDLTFGTGRRSSVGEWHLASDHEIVEHEGGHLAFDRIIPALSQWYSGDGGAIHEGFGDGIAALKRNDPELSEDFPPNIGRAYGTMLGLRTVAHSLKYNDVSSEVHDKGRSTADFGEHSLR